MRDWYADRDVRNSWSRPVLEHHVAAGLHERIGATPSNFTDRLDGVDAEQAQEIARYPYVIDLLVAPQQVSTGTTPKSLTRPRIRHKARGKVSTLLQSSSVQFLRIVIVDLMALITRTYLVDDIDGSEGNVSRVTFNLDRTDYEIDLSAANAERFREKLANFLDAASPVKTAKARSVMRGAKAPAARPSREQTRVVRDWARSNGFQVSDRGRISTTIQEAFDAAH